jgi:hypothetical protein
MWNFWTFLEKCCFVIDTWKVCLAPSTLLYLSFWRFTRKLKKRNDEPPLNSHFSLYIFLAHSNFKNFSPIKKFQKVWKSHSTQFNTVMKILSTLNKTRMFAWRNTSTSFQTNWIKIWIKFIRIEYWVRKISSIKIKLL